MRNEHQAPQGQGNAVGMHPVILLFKNSGKIGKPESSQNQKKEDDEVEVTFLEDGAFKFHAMGVDWRFVVVGVVGQTKIFNPSFLNFSQAQGRTG
ncbi:MAG: hypothetical protein IPO07_03580 [Haliscomenobacter sp.]|nr:hypothetical protein [Haliscomenobacter sp.]